MSQNKLRTKDDEDRLVEVTSLRDKQIVSIESKDFPVAISKEGQVFVWGLKGILIPMEVKVGF